MLAPPLRPPYFFADFATFKESRYTKGTLMHSLPLPGPAGGHLLQSLSLFLINKHPSPRESDRRELSFQSQLARRRPRCSRGEELAAARAALVLRTVDEIMDYFASMNFCRFFLGFPFLATIFSSQLSACSAFCPGC